MNKGKIKKIIGPVIDVEFSEGINLPDIYTALEVNKEDTNYLQEKPKGIY